MPPPRQLGALPPRYGLFRPGGAGVAAGAAAGASAGTDPTQLTASPLLPQPIVVVDLSDQQQDWLRLLAEQLAGDPARCQATDLALRGAGPLASATIGWTADPTDAVSAQIDALRRLDTDSLLRLTAYT